MAVGGINSNKKRILPDDLPEVSNLGKVEVYGPCVVSSEYNEQTQKHDLKIYPTGMTEASVPRTWTKRVPGRFEHD